MTAQIITIESTNKQARTVRAVGRVSNRERSRRRGLLLKLVMIGASVAVALVACEIIMRVFHLGDTRKVAVYGGKLFKLPPHTKFVDSAEGNNVIETNNLGFHDLERQAANDNYHILFLGDSFLEGRQVKTENLFTVRLEKALSREGQKIETINGGVPGTGTAYQYVLWKEFFESNIKVDHLVLCFFLGNDLIDNSPELRLPTFGGSESNFFVDSKGNVVDAVRRPSAFKRTINYFRERSVLLNTGYAAAYRISATIQQRAEANNNSLAGQGDRAASAWETSAQGTIALIRRWKSELAAKGIPFDVVIIDAPGKIYNQVEVKFVTDLEAACEQDQIGYLRLKLDGNPYDLYSFDGVYLGHFNEKGHEVTANQLHDYFKGHYGAIFNPSRK
jgi:lysophospholipase L1-like esterase